MSMTQPGNIENGHLDFETRGLAAVSKPVCEFTRKYLFRSKRWVKVRKTPIST